MSLTSNKLPLSSPNSPPHPSFLTPAIISPNSSLVFISGSCGVDPSLGQILPMDKGTVQDRTKLALSGVETILKEKGLGLGDVVSCTIYLSKYKQDFASFNEAYVSMFEGTGKPLPSRTCIGVANLPAGTDVEITCTALLPPHVAKPIKSSKAPTPAPFLSSAISTPTLTFVSGAVGIKPDGTWLSADKGYSIQDRTRQAMSSALGLLEECGLGLKDVIAATIYLTNYASSYGPVTEVWTDFFPGPHKPTRTCIGVADLPAGTDVEITITAAPRPDAALNIVNPIDDPAPISFLSKSISIPAPTNLIFLSGATADKLLPSSNETDEGVAGRTKNCLANIDALLKQQGGSGLGDVVSSVIYLSKYTEDFGKMNEAYIEGFRRSVEEGGKMPSRTCIGMVNLPGGTDVEITCIAASGNQAKSAL